MPSQGHENVCASAGGNRAEGVCIVGGSCIPVSLPFPHGQFQGKGPEGGCSGYVLVLGVFFLVSVYERLGFPGMLTHP